VVDHATGDVIWTGPGKDAAALDAFFAELGPERSAGLTAISMDMGKAYPKSARKDGHAPQAEICWDPFHVVAMGAKAMDTVRRVHWNQLRATTDPHTARRFKGARWALAEEPCRSVRPPNRRAGRDQTDRQRGVAGVQGQRGPAGHLRRRP
jgi:transposase